MHYYFEQDILTATKSSNSKRLRQGGNMFLNGDSILRAEIAPSPFLVEECEFAFLTDANQALKLLRECRWADGHFCPKCRSRDVMRTNSFVYRELLRCSRCCYSFNVTSLTIFHGSKLALNKHFQLLVAIDIGRKRLSPREIGAFVDVSERTVKLHLERHLAASCYRDSLQLQAVSEGTIRRNSLVATLTDSGATISKARFLLRLRQWLSI